ncbi:hypothetical protein GCM10029963_42290 [Micromonospora andamanensis]
MSGVWWWAVAVSPVLAAVLTYRMRGRRPSRWSVDGGKAADEQLVAWVVALREAGGQRDGEGPEGLRRSARSRQVSDGLR